MRSTRLNRLTYAVLLGALVLALPTRQASAQFVTIQGGASYPTIQAAINASTHGQVLIAQPRTYFERINFYGKRITVRSAAPNDPNTVEDTIIDGQSLGPVVTFTTGEDAATVLEGFTIQHGSAEHGGGIRCLGASPTIRGNVVQLNTATVNGGGIYITNGAAPTITANRINGNTCQGRGAGVFLQNSAAVISDNIIQSNFTQASSGGGIHLGAATDNVRVFGNVITLNTALFGGGVHVEYASPTIDRNRIIGNYGTPRGAGLSLVSASPRLANNVIAGNQSNLAAAIDINASSPQLVHNTIIANRAAQSAVILAANNSHPSILGNILAFHDNGYAIHVLTGSTANVDHNCFFANTTGDATGPVMLGDANLYADPRITQLGTWVDGQIPGGGGPEVEYVAALEGDAGASGTAEYQLRPTREKLEATVTDFPPNQTFPVKLNDLVIAQLPIDAQGGGELDLDTQDGTLPPNFPDVHVCDVLSIGNLVSGAFQLIGMGINCDAQVWQPGDEHLLPTSPCRDHGPSTDLTGNQVDWEGQLRPYAFIADIGADESVPPGTGDFDGDDDVDLRDVAHFQPCFGRGGDLACVSGDFAPQGPILLADYAALFALFTGP